MTQNRSDITTLGRTGVLFLVLSVGVLPASAIGQQSRSEAALDAFVRSIEAQREALIETRRDIHRHPELSGQEERTSALVAEHLRELGFEAESGVGGYGVVGLLRGVGDGPTIAFRADMDAVRSNAPDPVDFRSEIDGVRHICGHDIHTTIGLALASGFSAARDDLNGSVMLIFQPAEETASGARAMLEDGLFQNDKPDAIFAYHTTPYEVGQIAAARAVQMPGRDAVRIDVTGEGDLEAVAAEAAEVIRSVLTLTPIEIGQPQTDDFVAGQVRTARQGDGWRAVATLTTSSLERSFQARDAIESGLARLRTGGVSVDLTYQEHWIAGVTNTPELVDRANAIAMDVLGENAVLPVTSLVPAFSEDFGSFQAEVPGVMYFIGVSNSERGWVGMPHSPDYVADEESIFIGARTMAAVFFDLFENGVPGSQE